MGNRLSAILTLGMLLTSATALEAQKRCTKGIPCGNTCIAASKTCRIGTPRQEPTRRVLPSVVRGDSARGAPANADTAQAREHGAASRDSTRVNAPWVASSRGQVYYARGCSAARRLAPQNLIYFRTAEEAERAGYRRSRSRGC